MKGNSIRFYLAARLSAVFLLTASLLSASLLAGCTEGQIEEVVPPEARPVTLHFARPDLGTPVSLTRAEGTSEPLPAGATVRIAAYFRKATDGPVAFETAEPTYQATYEVKSDDGSLSPCTVDADGKKTADTGTGLTVRGGLYDFYAVSPARELSSVSGGSSYQVTGIPHKEDVMTSYKRGVTVSSTSPKVVVDLETFTRKCALVVFNVEPDGNNAVDFISLKGKKLKLKGISTYPAVLPVGETKNITATRGAISDPNAQMEFTEFTDLTSPGSLNKTKGAILPKLANSFDVEIEVERDGQTAQLSATIDPTGQTAFEAGKRYVFTLRVKNNKGTLFLRVLDWNTYAVNDPGVGTPGTVPPSDPDIIPGVGIPMQVAEWNDITWTGNGNSGASPFLTIDQHTADAYRVKFSNMTAYPPFNYDQEVPTGTTGIDYKGTSATCKVTTPYMIEVEATQSQIYYRYDTGEAINYCKNKGLGWRLPMIIELFAMWDKCRGTDNDATDEEEASGMFGDWFKPNFYYWSSSVYNGGAGQRCRLYFSGGGFGYGYTANTRYVRCVRDIN